MKNKSQLKAGVIMSYLNLIIGNLVPFFYTPIMLKLLGESEYGLYSLANSVIGYLSLLNFGLGTAMVRYIVKFKAKGDKEGERSMVGLFCVVFFIMAIAVLIGGIVLTLCVDNIYGNSLTLQELAKMKVLMILMTFNMVISFVFAVWSAILSSHEKYVFIQSINILSTIGIPLFNLVMLYMGFASIGLVLSSTVISCIIYISQVVYTVKNIGITPSFKNMPFDLMGELLGFCFFVFLNTIVNRLHADTDKVIIGAILGTASVGYYNIGVTMRNIVTQLSTGISSVLMPKITNMVFSGKTDTELSDYLIKIGRLQFYIVALVVSGFVAFGKPFIEFWAGPNYWEAYYVTVIVTIPMAVPLMQNVAVSIITARNKHRFRAVVTLCTAIANVFLTYWFVKVWGIIGAALTTGVCNVAGSIIIMNWYYYKKMNLDIPRFWKNILPMLIVPVSLSVIALLIGMNGLFYNKIYFVVGIVVYSIIYAVLMWTLYFNESEKDLFLGFIRKFIKKKA